MSDNNLVRLQKFMAEAGVASRRASEQIIKDGKVKVNGEIVREVGTKINPDKDVVEVSGRRINKEIKTYLLLNKPEGYVCTNSDKHAEKTIYDLLPRDKKLHSIGRLDKDTEGLILITNDGSLTQKLTHPSYQVNKTYSVIVNGNINRNEIDRLQKGVLIEEDDGSVIKTAPAKVKLLYRGKNTSAVEITIHEGRKRQIRKMIKAIGHRVIQLKRIKEGFLTLEGVKKGKYRHLTKEEVRRLKEND